MGKIVWCVGNWWQPFLKFLGRRGEYGSVALHDTGLVTCAESKPVRHTRDGSWFAACGAAAGAPFLCNYLNHTTARNPGAESPDSPRALSRYPLPSPGSQLCGI